MTQYIVPSAVQSVPACIVCVILRTPVVDRRLLSSTCPVYVHMNYVERGFRNRRNNQGLYVSQENQLWTCHDNISG